MRKKKTSTKVSRPSSKGQSLLTSLMRTLEAQDFDYQLTKTAKHYGVSKATVLKEILGR